MSLDKEAHGGKAFALYPLRHTNVPQRRLDQDALKYCSRVSYSEGGHRKAATQKLETKKEQDMGAVNDLR